MFDRAREVAMPLTTAVKRQNGAAKYCVLRPGVFAITVSVEVSLGTKLTKLRIGVGLHIDLTLLHSCTFVSLVTELSCALDHSSNAFALSQVASQNRLPFDIVCLTTNVLAARTPQPSRQHRKHHIDHIPRRLHSSFSLSHGTPPVTHNPEHFFF